MEARGLGDIERTTRKKPNKGGKWLPKKSCDWCGTFYGKQHQCLLTADHKKELRKFARKNGRTWKVELRRFPADAYTTALREAMTIIGHAGLYRIKVDTYLLG